MTSDTNEEPAGSYINKALVHNQSVGDKHEPFLAASRAICDHAAGRVGLLELIQVIAMDPSRPACLQRPMVKRIEDALADQSVGGLADGIEAHRIIAAAAVAEKGGVQGCPIWDSSFLQQLPAWQEEPDEEGTSRDDTGDLSVDLPEVQLPAEATWKTDAAQLAALVSKILSSHNKLIAKVNILAQDIMSACKAEAAAHERNTWETNTLWWSQALYSQAQGKPYREIAKTDRLFWMAFDLAAVGPPHRHNGLESFFVETVRRTKLTDSVDKNESLEKRARSLLALSDPPDRSNKLAKVVAADATCLPITWLLTRHGKEAGTVFKEFADVTQTWDEEWNLAKWATQLLRELQLERWLEETEK